MTPGIRLYVDGVKVADGSPGEDSTAPYAVDGLTVSWGRPTTVDQPDASSCSFTLYSSTHVPDPDLFATKITIGREILLDAGLDDWPVFIGQITDVSMVVSDDDPTGTLVLNVTCDDVLSDLNNRPAASTPLPVQSVATRVATILAAARLDTPYVVASDLGGIPVKRIDPDQGGVSTVAAMLADIATSVDGVLWSTAAYVNPPPYVLSPSVWLESPATRAPLRRLALDPTSMLVVIVDVSTAAGALHLDPCVIDLEPIEWRQTMSDLVTGVEVTYYVPDPDDPTKDIGKTVTIVEPGAESPDRPWGVRRMSIDSQLTTPADSSTTAGKIIGRLSSPTWRLANVTVDNAVLPTVSDADMRTLLAMRTRHGLPITIYPLPDWAPPSSDTFTGYLEGGDITSTGGVWSVNLWLSSAQSYAGVSGRWIDLPADPDWTWADIDPAIQWNDLNGVGGPV